MSSVLSCNNSPWDEHATEEQPQYDDVYVPNLLSKATELVCSGIEHFDKPSLPNHLPHIWSIQSFQYPLIKGLSKLYRWKFYYGRPPGNEAVTDQMVVLGKRGWMDQILRSNFYCLIPWAIIKSLRKWYGVSKWIFFIWGDISLRPYFAYNTCNTRIPSS